MVMIYVWLAVVCVSAIVEAFTLQMAGIWFVVGGFVALIMAACDVPLEWQIIACIVVSLVLLLSLRRLCLRFILKKDNTKTNVDALIDSKIKLLEDTVNSTSSARINDVVWTVVIEGEQEFKKGTVCIVTEVQGNRLLARPLSGTEQEIEKSGEKEIDGDVIVPTEDIAEVKIAHNTESISSDTNSVEVEIPTTTAEPSHTQESAKKTTKKQPASKSKNSKK